MNIKDGKSETLKGGNPVFTNTDPKTAHVSWPCGNGSFEIDLGESVMTIKTKGNVAQDWAFELNVDKGSNIPVKNVADKQVNYSFDDHLYQLKAKKGTFDAPGGSTTIRLSPEKGTIKLLLTN